MDQLPRSTSLWGDADGTTMEDILRGVTDDGVPRISEVLNLLARALGKDDNLVLALDPADPVLTDAIRCILCHPWLVGSVERKNNEGAVVASFFTRPFGNARVLNLFSSRRTFQRLEGEAAKDQEQLSAVELSFGEIMMSHIPNMNVGAMKRNGASEENAVRALSFDPATFWDPALDEDEEVDENVVVFSDSTFKLFQFFCHCYALAGAVLELQQGLTAGAINEQAWGQVLRKESLNAIMTDESVFANEQGMLLFCYPGDAAKVLKYHSRKGTAGLTRGKVASLEPQRFLELMTLNARKGVGSVIAATVLEQASEIQLHGLRISPAVFLDTVLEATGAE